MLRARELLREGAGETEFFVSGEPESFAAHAEDFLTEPMAKPVQRVDIDRY